MLTLFKKDLLLMKKQLYIMFLFQAILTPILLKQLEGNGVIGGYLIYFLMMFISVLVLQNTISIAEATDQRAISYLCALPYKRSSLVLEKYFLDIILIAAYSLIYCIESLVIASVPSLAPWACFVCILGITIYRAIYIPIEYKFGYEKTKFATTIFALVVPFGLTGILSKIDLSAETVSFLDNLPEGIVLLAVIILTFIIMTISSLLSVSIFNHKDL